MVIYMLLALLIASMALPIFVYNRGSKTKKRGMRALAGNLVSFTAVFIVAMVFVFTQTTYAAEAAGALSDAAASAAFIGAALVTGAACIGTGIAVSSAASAAIGAISENEKVMGKALIFVSMAEGIAIYGLLVAFMILNKV